MTSWKDTLKQEKAVRDQKVAESLRIEKEAETTKLKEQAEEARKILEKALGVTLPESPVPTWSLDGYTFSLLDRMGRYDPYTMHIEKDVPLANESIFEEDDDIPYGYRTKRLEQVDLPFIRGILFDDTAKRIFDALADAGHYADFRIELAEAITLLDNAVISQEETNDKLTKQYFANQAKVDQPEPVAPKPRIQIMTTYVDPVINNGAVLKNISDYVNEGWQIISTHYAQSSAKFDGVVDTDYTLIFVLQRTVYDAPTPPEPEKVAVTPEYANVTEPITIETPAESPAGEEDEQPEEVVILNPQMTIVQPTNPELLKLTEKLPNARRILEVGIDTFREEQNAEVADAVLARLAISQNSETFQALTTSRPLGGQLPAPIFSEN